MNFISGEKIQFLCDHFLGHPNDFTRNHQNLSKHYGQSVKVIKFSELNSDFNNKGLIYCYTQSLQNLNALRKTLNYMKNPFNLIFHNSDDNFNKKHLKLFDELPLLQHIYTQNMDVLHPKVTPLPIGFANSMWPHGNTQIHTTVYNMDIPKTKNIYFYFSIHTSRKKRQECFDSTHKKNISWNKKLPYKQYLMELKSHKYAISPEGNGIDCHRFWECLYMDVIPICKKNILVEYYKQFFPIIILNNWSELDLDFLENEYSKLKIDHKYLNLQYIKELINVLPTDG